MRATIIYIFSHQNKSIVTPILLDSIELFTVDISIFKFSKFENSFDNLF